MYTFYDLIVVTLLLVSASVCVTICVFECVCFIVYSFIVIVVSCLCVFSLLFLLSVYADDIQELIPTPVFTVP